jgi:hypothetical protein
VNETSSTDHKDQYKNTIYREQKIKITRKQETIEEILIRRKNAKNTTYREQCKNKTYSEQYKKYQRQGTMQK